MGCQKVPWKVPPRFHRGSTKVSPRLRKFRYLSGLLGQIVLGAEKVPRKAPPRFRQGSTKVSARVHQGSTKVLQVSWCLWFSGADPSWAAKRFRLKMFCGRFAKVPRRFHQGCASFGSLWSSRADPFRGAKRFCGRFPDHFFKLVPQFLNSFLYFSPTALALGSSAIVKVSGQNDTFVFRVLCSKWLSPPKRFFGVFPKQFFTLVSQSPAVFGANGCCFRKGSVEGSANNSLDLSPKWLLLHKSSLEGSANCALHLSPSLIVGSKRHELLTCLTDTNPIRRKRPIMSLLLGYSLG